ncbi:MAG: hypothetical protein MJ081_06300 [Ruminococcus sp.]|nr:hypothetical protein [Ruminococcus sp.]
MKVTRKSYWDIVEYILENSHFIENTQNPKDITALDFSEEGKGVWLKNILEKFSPVYSREEVLTVFHILEVRELIRMNYVAAEKDHRIMDLTAKGYEEYLIEKEII